MFKNTASQKWTVFAFESEAGTNPGKPVTGDAANITANLRLDGGAANAVDDTNPAELEDGQYVFDITQAESNADLISIAPVSGTANVSVIGLPGAIYTRDWALGAIAAILVDTETTLDTKINDLQGAGFVTATDSNEALRNRGDAAWQGGPTISASGTAVAGSTTTLTEEVGQESPENSLIGQLLHITSGTGAPQSKAIEANVFATGVITIIGTWSGVSPDATSVYQVTPNDIDEITDPPTAAVITDAVWNENTSGHTAAGTFGEQVKNDIDAILVDTGSTLDGKINTVDTVVDAILVDTAVIGAAGAGLTGIPWSAAWDAEVQSEVADALAVYDGPTKAELDTLIGTPAADVSADIAAVKVDSAAILVDTDTTLDTLINGIDGKVDTIDTVVDAIRVETDKLTFTVANRLDVNTRLINSVVVIGAGTSGDKWRA